MPQRPDGKQVTIQFGSVFERKASALDIVTLILERDGAWRVAGYELR